MTDFILRVNGSVGRCRLLFDSKNTTLRDVKQRCAEKFSVPYEEVALTLQRNGAGGILHGDNRKLRDLGLQSGVEVFLHSLTTPVMMSSTPSLVSKGLAGQGSQLIASPKGDGASSAFSKSRKSGTRKGTKSNKEHKFKPFEKFLDETEFQITSLPLTMDYRPVKKNRHGATKLPPTISLKHQLYRHVDHLEVMNIKEMSQFVAYWRRDMAFQRAAFLIGYYKEDPHYNECGVRAVVEAVYEPPQMSHTDCVEIQSENPFLPVVERIAAALGLEIIGWVFTHLPRKKLITASEILQMGRLQLDRIHRGLHYTGYPISTFVTMTISPKEELRGEAGPDAFMLSDLGLAMIRDDLLSTNGTGEDDPLLIRQPNHDELMPMILETAQGVDKLDTDWLLVRVVDSAPKEPRSIFKRTSFPRMGRDKATFKDLRVFLQEAPALLKSYERYADFHFILYVAEVFGVDSALAICEAIMTHSAVDPAFEEVMQSLDS
eukprot:Blabericola_migrator_1__5927@NODE_299_length_10197_cov_100_341955_g246_i0_p2_GENE_NODE_299_length_10197_cov_100_341955_g246_i0NODE_299_length_10197_cov_100_341955_g246_i0_p2_ORF_typecomplete_len489_score96_78NPL4/PF05021_15/6_4e51zfNPL4/PF05020_15/1_8e14UN_NPL4/PF11543_8/5_7e07ubiquitin/PF00240_23/0_00065Ubiquitin_2/PF14560_6/0_0023_NODE_299_length_10197_cov_100_341955_g246_i015633029